MKYIYLLILAMQLIIYCTGKTTLELSIINRSSFAIDSSIIPNQPITWTKRIKRGETKIFINNVSQIDLHREDVEAVLISYNNMKLECN